MNSKIYAALAAASLVAIPAVAFAQPTVEPVRDPAAVQAGAYDVEPLHTRVLFSVSHLGFTTWYGEFTNVSGSLNLDPKNPAGMGKIIANLQVENTLTKRKILYIFI